MRILSQDGRTDIPYENFVLSITQDNCIVSTRDTAARTQEILLGVVARYSTAEKAQEAMEMLRKAYSPALIINRATIEPDEIFANDFIISPADSSGIEVNHLENYYFQFPADDEIEV